MSQALTCLGMFFVKFRQNRHPERSAAQMDRVTQRLWRGVEEPVLSVAEGTSAVLSLPMLLVGMFCSKDPQNRHPERSASQMGPVTQRWWRGVEGPRQRLIDPLLLLAFQPQGRQCLSLESRTQRSTPELQVRILLSGVGGRKLRAAVGQ